MKSAIFHFFIVTCYKSPHWLLYCYRLPTRTHITRYDNRTAQHVISHRYEVKWRIFLPPAGPPLGRGGTPLYLAACAARRRPEPPLKRQKVALLATIYPLNDSTYNVWATRLRTRYRANKVLALLMGQRPIQVSICKTIQHIIHI